MGRLSIIDRVIMAVTPFALLAAGFLAAGMVDRPAMVGQRFKIVEDSPLYRCDYHGNQACTADEVPAMDVEVTVSLSGDPLTDCFSLLAAAGYADSLAEPMCKIVEGSLG